MFDDDRYWSVDVTYAKASPTEVLMRIEVENHGPDEATLDVLPTLWFRNTWSWDPGARRPRIEGDGAALTVADHDLAGYRLDAAPGPDGALPTVLACENETNVPRVFGGEPTTPYPKDGINDHVVAGAETVNPDGSGTKAALHYRVTVAAGGKAELRLKLHQPRRAPAAGWAADAVRRRARRTRGRRRRVLRGARPGGDGREHVRILRQACAGLIWSKQMYPFNVRRWLDGDPGCHRHLRRAATAATPAGGTSTRSTCWRCRTRGSTRGSRPGTSGSTASRGRTSTRPSRSTSCSCCSASGSSTRTARCRPTSGTSTT